MDNGVAIKNGGGIRALVTALGVAVICALLVSYTAVTLRPYYIANLEAERDAQLASILSALSGAAGRISSADIEMRLVDLDSGAYTEALDPLTYDAGKAATDPAMSRPIAPELDLAGIKRRPNYAVAYIHRDQSGAVRMLILPVYGVGYQSTLFGYLALSEDANSVLALKFYEQNDTPGIGARIQDPAWEAMWPGKLVIDEDGNVRIGVARGPVPAGSPDIDYVVDGISGATRTSLGVHGLLRFWLGESGFGPYLARVRKGEG